MKRALVPLIAAVGVLTLTLAGCSSTNGHDGIRIVTSTNVWAAVATAVAGDKASVEPVFTANTDPHEFEPSAADTADIIDADIIVINGGGYDAYLEHTADAGDSTPAVVNAYALLGAPEHDGDNAGHGEHGDEHTHEHGTTNEHVFYDLPIVAQVATKIADALAAKDEANADFYRANAAAFGEQIQSLRERLATIARTDRGAKVAQSEPLAGYLLAEAGLVDASPAGFTQSVEEGQSPSIADRAAMDDLLRNRTVRTFIYNTQSVDSVTVATRDLAQTSGVPVVQFTETLPDGVRSYIDWQSGQIDALADALGRSR
ncbi:zinc ABC transporter substrate-binding protein [Gordonia sp. ABSL1-1]|uniref:metal ABC transporter solute-binding protein, Zn/Mn family n=1 Tax=Gordonia sp. ABSL1-1 TaxID=3053923 RepID=UPI002574453F|nr:zinc ABC transporter substrate-binding protein [Gordonia sp. ABSL1-1]MDL9936136.1 zinc ABC transporter substrate-binding protein [Gordonia sp. ABSL1-1]